MASTRITILTVGSRGDVQPFLALSLGLRKVAYRVRIATNPEFEAIVRERGVDFADLGPNPNETFPKLASTERKDLPQTWLYARQADGYVSIAFLPGIHHSWAVGLLISGTRRIRT